MQSQERKKQHKVRRNADDSKNKLLSYNWMVAMKYIFIAY